MNGVTARTRAPRLTGQWVITDDSSAAWVVTAEYMVDGRPVVDLNGNRHGRVVRRNSVPVSELLDPETGGPFAADSPSSV